MGENLNAPGPTELATSYFPWLVHGWWPESFMLRLHSVMQLVLGSTVTPGEVCVDLGANVGRHTLAMREAVGSMGRVIAVEPHPRLAQQLRGLDVEVVEAAICLDETSVTRFWAPKWESGSHEIGSTLPNYAEKFFGLSEDALESFTVPSLQLGALLQGKGITDVAFLKVDIEGLDTEVLLRASTELGPDRFPAVVAWEHNAEVAGSSASDLVAALNALGMVVFDSFFNVLTTETALDPRVSPIDRFALSSAHPAFQSTVASVRRYWAGGAQ